MPNITIRNLPDEVHRALKARAAQRGRSMDAEIREILETAVRSPPRVGLGSMLTAIGREVGLTDDDCALFDQLRDKTLDELSSFKTASVPVNNPRKT